MTSNHSHNFRESTKNGYELCIDCGTYHSVQTLPPDDIYVNKDYWGEGTGRSTFEDQIKNMTCIDECGISKIDRVLQFVPKYGKTVIEIGCAPGELLRRLTEMGYDAIGIEPNVKYIEPILRVAPKAKIIHGYFPEIFTSGEYGYCDCIVALDVMEHCEDTDAFFGMIYNLLKPAGTAIIMSPIIYDDGLMDSKNFLPNEHCWIYTKRYLEPYLEAIFREVKFTRWICGHEMIILTK